MDFSGHLSAFPAASILQWAANERRTGALVVRRTRCEKRIYFRDGRVVACLSDDPGESYGRYLLLHGYVAEENLVRALQRCRQSGRRLGAVLVELGTLSEAQVRDTLCRQFSDTVCDIFLWQRGIFYFEADDPTAEEIPPEAIDTMGLVLEGTRWVDEVARIRKVLAHDNVVLRHGPKYPVGGLTVYESRIGATVDGRSNLADVYATIRGSYFRFLDAVHRLCRREVLDVYRVGEPYEPPSGDLKLSELILERSREGALSVPVSALGKLYPVLTVPPEQSQLGRQARYVAELLVALDGRTALGDLLADDPDHAEQQVEAVLVEMRQGRLALLPAPPERLDTEADRDGAPAAGRWWRLLVPK
jgi:Domain of unknown function (DUF4388)